MRRKVTLAGELKEKFGEVFYINADSHQDLLKCISANRPGFKKYLLDAIDKDIGFTIDMADKSVESEEDLLLPLKEGDVTITSIPAGSKTGIGKIIAAVAIAYLMIVSAGTAALAAPGSTFAAGTSAFSAGISATTTFSGLQMMGMTLAANLAITGYHQIMAPDPSVDDSDEASTYLFQGSQQTIIEGDPIPILYGELRVPGRPIAMNIEQGRYKNNNVVIDRNNNLDIIDSEKDKEYT
tara:strand:- start:198 stop:914 length:717 start_codon:yes stop_codon:yes gene_type:complete